MTELEDVILTPRYAPRLRPTPIPSAGVFDAPAVCVLINRKWVGHLLGVLEALDQPDTWLGSSAEIDTARQNVRQLMVALILGNCDVTQFDIRLKPGSSCIIQKTLDGVNWIDAIDMSGCWKSGIRRNPATDDWGYYDGIDFYRFPDGAWIDDPSGLHIPSPKARSEGTDDQKRCDAAYGAALALQSLYRQTWDVFTKWTTLGVFWVTQQMMSMAEDLLGIGTSISVMGEYAEELYQQSPAFVEGGFPDSKLETCQNVLYCNSSVDAEGRVAFDSAAVQTEFGDLYASDGAPWGGLNFLITLFLGADGLNAAGNVDGGVGNCANADCFPLTCPTITFEDASEQYTILKGSLIAGAGENGGTVLAAQQTSATLQELLVEFPVSCDITSITYRMKYKTNRGDNLLTRTMQVWYNNNTQSTTVGTGNATHAPQDTWVTGSLNPHNVAGATKVRFGLAWSRNPSATGYVYLDSITINGSEV